MNILSILRQNPVIYAARNDEAVMKAVKSRAGVIFLLKTDLFSAERSVALAHQSGKAVFVHVDLMDGLGRDEIALRYVAEVIKPDGIITTKAQVVKTAKSLGLKTVFRAFLVDSQGLETAMHTASKIDTDFVEIMPGVIPSAIRRFSGCGVNLIAGGLIASRSDVDLALSSGALAVSTSAEEVFA